MIDQRSSRDYVSRSACTVVQGEATSTPRFRSTTMSSVPSVVKIWIISLSGYMTAPTW